jgi:hypothetical protein
MGEEVVERQPGHRSSQHEEGCREGFGPGRFPFGVGLEQALALGRLEAAPRKPFAFDGPNGPERA